MTQYHGYHCLRCGIYHTFCKCKSGLMPCNHPIKDLGMYIIEKHYSGGAKNRGQIKYRWQYKDRIIEGYGDYEDVLDLKEAWTNIFMREAEYISKIHIDIKIKKTMKIVPVDEIGERTRDVIFKRQLRPPPPMNAKPHWCYQNSLVFYDEDYNNVWEQRIPEADWVNFRQPPKNESPFHCSLELDPHWGWMLVVKTSHECAYAIWRQVFNKKVHELNGGVKTTEIGKEIIVPGDSIPVFKYYPEEGDDADP